MKTLGADWSAFQNGKDVYISHKKSIGTALAESVCQITEDEANKIVDAGLILRKYVLQNQMPFSGSFNQMVLREPVAKPLLTLLDVLL